MSNIKKTSRRNVLKAGIAGASAAMTASITTPQSEAALKDDRPTLLALMGQHCHNPIFMEQNLRFTLAKMNWRILFAQYS